MSARFTHVARGVRRITLGDVTYTATYYPPGGTPGYWVVRRSDQPADADNDWYASSWANCRAAILAVAAKRTCPMCGGAKPSDQSCGCFDNGCQ